MRSHDENNNNNIRSNSKWIRPYEFDGVVVVEFVHVDVNTVDDRHVVVSR